MDTWILIQPLLTLYTIQKYNAYLKVIADLCGITNALSNGVSIESISKMLGHANTKITQEYARVSDLKITNEMKLIKRKLFIN